MITRRNLNVQPTIKVPVGYKFTVRVNRDILFDAPYQPMQADPQVLIPGDRQLRHRTALVLRRINVKSKKFRKRKADIGVRLFLRLNADVNKRLRSLLRYQGELSRYINEALTQIDLDGVRLVPARLGKSTPGLTAVISASANAGLRHRPNGERVR